MNQTLFPTPQFQFGAKHKQSRNLFIHNPFNLQAHCLCMVIHGSFVEKKVNRSCLQHTKANSQNSLLVDNLHVVEVAGVAVLGSITIHGNQLLYTQGTFLLVQINGPLYNNNWNNSQLASQRATPRSKLSQIASQYLYVGSYVRWLKQLASYCSQLARVPTGQLVGTQFQDLQVTNKTKICYVSDLVCVQESRNTHLQSLSSIPI